MPFSALPKAAVMPSTGGLNANITSMPHIMRLVRDKHVEWESQRYLPNQEALNFLKSRSPRDLSRKENGIQCSGITQSLRTVSVFFDTPTQALRSALGREGIFLRVRYGNAAFSPQASVKCNLVSFIPNIAELMSDRDWMGPPHMRKRLEFEAGVSLQHFDPNRPRFVKNEIVRAAFFSIVGEEVLRPVFVTASRRVRIGFNVTARDGRGKQTCHFETALDNCEYHYVDPESKVWTSNSADISSGILVDQNRLEDTEIRGSLMAVRPQIENEIKLKKSTTRNDELIIEAERRLCAHIESHVGPLRNKKSKPQEAWELLDKLAA